MKLGRNEYLGMIFGLLMGALLVGTFVSAWNEPVPHYQSQPAEAKGNDTSRGGAHAPKSDGSKHGGERKQESHWYDTFFDHMPDWFVALFTGVLVCVTVALVRSTNKLWEAGERQLRHSADTAQRQLRAYISVEADPSLPPPHVSPQGIEVTFKTINRGQTPAGGVFNWAVIMIAPTNGPVSFRRPRGLEFVANSMAPGSDASIRARFSPWRDGEWDAVCADRFRAYVFGRVYYRDAFGRRRYTQYRYRIVISPTGQYLGIALHETGNKSY